MLISLVMLHCTLVILHFIMLIMWVAFFMLCVHQPLLSFSSLMPVYHHLSLPSSFMFLQATLFPPPLIFIYFMMILLNAFTPLCQISSHLELVWLGSKMAQV